MPDEEESTVSWAEFRATLLITLSVVITLLMAMWLSFSDSLQAPLPEPFQPTLIAFVLSPSPFPPTVPLSELTLESPGQEVGPEEDVEETMVEGIISGESGTATFNDLQTTSAAATVVSPPSTLTKVATVEGTIPTREYDTPIMVAAVGCGIVPPGWVPYVIRPGDTLFRLSANTGATISEVAQANCLNRNLIYSGTVIYLPARPPVRPICGPPWTWIPYTVIRGDTLYSLARRYGTTVYAIMQANCLVTSRIDAGMSLYLPAIEPIATLSATPTATPTPRATPLPQNTATPTQATSPTATQTASPTPTSTRPLPATGTATGTATATATAPPTNTPTGTPIGSPSATPTGTPTATPTGTASATPSPTQTPTSPPTQTPTNTPTAVPTNTPTNTATPTSSPTSTSTPTPTSTPTNTIETDQV